ncbi:hypothetical protein EON67_05470 [archaeon]|nr:MAG: hypothetical protein EON67_05470 [archaeon]
MRVPPFFLSVCVCMRARKSGRVLVTPAPRAAFHSSWTASRASAHAYECAVLLITRCPCAQFHLHTKDACAHAAGTAAICPRAQCEAALHTRCMLTPPRCAHSVAQLSPQAAHTRSGGS